MLIRILFQTIFFCALAVNLYAATILTGTSAGMKYQVEEVASGLGVVWGMAFFSTHELLFTEREGRIKKIHLMSKEVTDLLGDPAVFAKGQGGMLDVAVPENVAQDDWVYFTYVKENKGEGVTVLARTHVIKDRLTDWQDLLITDSATDTNRHFGSRITFDDKGHVFFSVGDRGVRPNGQDTSNHAGTIIRLNIDGSVPEDNPFKGEEGREEIWSFGHRNPQGLFYDVDRSILWENEHGPRGGDEINIIEAGKNYGWPVVSHGKEYWGPLQVGEAKSKAGMIDPVKVYIPSIAPGSLLVYSGKAFSEWRGNLFSGALALVHLNRVVLDDKNNPVSEERMLSDLDERIRALAESPEGWLYLSTDSGRILCIKPRL